MVRFLARATKCEVILRAAYLLLQQESLRLYGKILSGKKCEVRIMCPETQLASKALSVLDRTSLEQQRGGSSTQVAPRTRRFTPQAHPRSRPRSRSHRCSEEGCLFTALQCFVFVCTHISGCSLIKCSFQGVQGPVFCGKKLLLDVLGERHNSACPAQAAACSAWTPRQWPHGWEETSLRAEACFGLTAEVSSTAQRASPPQGGGLAGPGVLVQLHAAQSTNSASAEFKDNTVRSVTTPQHQHPC